MISSLALVWSLLLIEILLEKRPNKTQMKA